MNNTKRAERHDEAWIRHPKMINKHLNEKVKKTKVELKKECRQGFQDDQDAKIQNSTRLNLIKCMPIIILDGDSKQVYLLYDQF